jgi:hypothetical protein
MSALGELPKVDAAVHADTTHEKSATYEFAEKWTPWLEDRGVRVVVVHDKKATRQVWDGKMIPAFTWSKKLGRMERGQAIRTCTQRWKVVPIRRWLQANREKRSVEMWLGISTDEAVRMKDSRVKYIINKHPLIDMEMSREDCVEWLVAKGLDVPVSSSCVFCPYHSMKEWREIIGVPEDFERSVKVDNTIRNKRPPRELFIHPARVPLVDVDLRTPKEKGQLSLWDEECEGICGV